MDARGGRGRDAGDDALARQCCAAPAPHHAAAPTARPPGGTRSRSSTPRSCADAGHDARTVFAAPRIGALTTTLNSACDGLIEAVVRGQCPSTATRGRNAAEERPEARRRRPWAERGRRGRRRCAASSRRGRPGCPSRPGTRRRRRPSPPARRCRRRRTPGRGRRARSRSRRPGRRPTGRRREGTRAAPCTRRRPGRSRPRARRGVPPPRTTAQHERAAADHNGLRVHASERPDATSRKTTPTPANAAVTSRFSRLEPIRLPRSL